MLARLPSSLPRVATTLSGSTTASIPRFPACARFNTSEAAPASAPAPDVDANSDNTSQAQSVPKRRAVPLAETLGDISISKKWGGKPKKYGQKPLSWEGSGDGKRQGRPPRRDDGFRRDNQAQREPRPPRSRPAYAVSRPIAPRQWQENATPSEHAQAKAQEVEVKEVPVKSSRSPAHPKVQLGNIDDLFGSHAPLAPSKKPSAPKVTPSQARVQLLLERTGGDYSRYAPHPFPNTTVTNLGPLNLAEFTLAYQRDVTPRGRQNVLAVVKKFADRGTQAATA